MKENTVSQKASREVGDLPIDAEEQEGIFGYTGPRTLEDIENRLLEIEQEKPARIHNASDNYTASWDDEIEAMEIAQLNVEKAVLQMKRQFILDERDSWKARFLWNIAVPIIVAVVTAYIVAKLSTGI